MPVVIKLVLSLSILLLGIGCAHGANFCFNDPHPVVRDVDATAGVMVSIGS